MNIVCDKCGKSNIYVVRPEPEKEAPKKMTEVTSVGISSLVYKMTTLKCKDCGFEHSY